MKKLLQSKSLLFLMVVLAVGMIASPLKANAALNANLFAQYTITETVDYKEEVLKLSGIPTPYLYFAEVKSASVTSISDTLWEEALLESDEKNSGEYKTSIDFSYTNATKPIYYAISIDRKDWQIVTIESQVYKVTATLNTFATKPEDKVMIVKTYADSKDKTGTETLNWQWKKGVNGDWKDASQLTLNTVRSYQVKGASLYVRVNEKNKRFSKIVNVKVNKLANAPSIKVDGSRLSLNIKNGMEYSLDDRKTWKTIKLFKKGVNDAYYQSTQVTNLSIYDILGIDKSVLIPARTIYVRTAATQTKVPSKIRTIAIPAQSSAPTNAEITKIEKIAYNKTTSGTAIDIKKDSKYDYEYTIVAKTNATEADVDFAKAKWSSISEGTTKKIATDGTKVKVGYTMLIRRKTVAYNKTKDWAFELASKCFAYVIQ